MTERSLRSRIARAEDVLSAVLGQPHRALKPLLQKLIDADDVVFDIGADTGQFTKLLSKTAPDGTVYAVEASPYACAILDTVMRIRRLYNIAVVTTALLAENDAVAHRDDDEDLERDTTLDRLCAAHDLRPSFVRLNASAAALRTLHGAATLLRDTRPALLLDATGDPSALSKQERGELLHLLSGAGYTAFAVNGATVAPTDGATADRQLFLAHADPRRAKLGV